MQIPKQLPQFDGSPTLFIIAGREEAKILFAKDGKISEIGRWKAAHPRYTDREGFFKTRSKGGIVTKAGAAYDMSRMEDDVTLKFYRTMRNEIYEISKKYPNADYYLFAPGHKLSRLLDILGRAQTKKIKRTFRGNYGKSHPRKILQMVGARRERRLRARKPIPPKARKLLS